jgi:hypothetical protein
MTQIGVVVEPREVSVAERNLLGRGLFGKIALQYGQYTKGAQLSYVETLPPPRTEYLTCLVFFTFLLCKFFR